MACSDNIMCSSACAPVREDVPVSSSVSGAPGYTFIVMGFLDEPLKDKGVLSRVRILTIPRDLVGSRCEPGIEIWLETVSIGN